MHITSSKKAMSFLEKKFHQKQEEVWAIYLGPIKQVLCSELVSRGTVDHCPVHPRDIFRTACIINCSSLLISHNHIFDNHYPSEKDIAFTKKLKTAGIILGIPLIDHIIISKSGYFSFADANYIIQPNL